MFKVHLLHSYELFLISQSFLKTELFCTNANKNGNKFAKNQELNTTQNTKILSKLYRYDLSSVVFWEMFKGDLRNRFLKIKP